MNLLKKKILPLAVAFLLWFVMFSPITKKHIEFWFMMSISAVILILFSFFQRKDWKEDFNFKLKYLFLGIIFSVILWGVFYLGDFFSSLLFNFSKSQIAEIYSIKTGVNTLKLSLALALLIGPAEEIFWRGFIQNDLSKYFNKSTGFLLATAAYTLVHISSLNFMLIMSSLVCGIFWGFLYKKYNNLWVVIISHSIWDCAIFIYFPIH